MCTIFTCKLSFMWLRFPLSCHKSLWCVSCPHFTFAESSSNGARPGSSAATTTAGLSVVAEERGGESSAGGDTTASAGDTTQGAMEVDPSKEKPDEVRSKDPLAGQSSFILEPLSRQLQLDNLWHALSECLDMLAQTSDPHAVLILQSTVEAFFLVHANNPDEAKPMKKSRSGGSRSRSSGQLSLFRAGSESGDPSSPAPRMDFSPVPSTPGLAKGEESYSHLPPDTARFLMFAGECYLSLPSLFFLTFSMA